jgi:hypothetical protein
MNKLIAAESIDKGCTIEIVRKEIGRMPTDLTRQPSGQSAATDCKHLGTHPEKAVDHVPPNES